MTEGIDFFKEHEEGQMSTIQKIVYASVGTGTFLIMLGISLYILGMQQTGGGVFLLGIIVGLLPYGLIQFFKTRAIKELEDQFPSFLKDLAESKRGGMTLLQSLESAKETDYGRLNSEIERIHNELTWGVPFPEVMERFSKRMEDSAVIQESVSILLQSFQSGGDITKTIESIAEDSSDLKETIQQKNSEIKQQIMIMYVIYLLFIGITVGIYWILAELLGLGDPAGGALDGLQFMGDEGGRAINYCSGQILAANPLCQTSQLFGFVPENITSFTSDYATQHSYGNMAYYKSLLFSMLMVQGICTGAVAGQISDGSPSSGIKHMMILLPIAFIVFMLTVGTAGV